MSLIDLFGTDVVVSVFEVINASAFTFISEADKIFFLKTRRYNEKIVSSF
jgi:hypothetical protein